MSIKIENGYRIPTMDLMTFNQWILTYQKQIEQLNETRLVKLLAARFTEVLDDYFTLEHETFCSRHLVIGGTKRSWENIKRSGILRTLYQTVMAEYFEMKRTKERHNEVDFDTQISVLPMADQTLLLLFAETDAAHEALKAMDGVAYYGYWNNVDPDETCTKEEWAKRKEDWEKALPGLGVPSEHGMTITITEGVPRFSAIRAYPLADFLPSVDARTSEKAMSEVIESIFQQLKEEDPDENEFRLIRRAMEGARTDTYAAQRQTEQTLYGERLFLPLEEALFWTFEELQQAKETKVNQQTEQ